MTEYLDTIIAAVTGIAVGAGVVRFWVRKLAREANAALDELERTAWSLGGRLRSQRQPSVYITPPGHPEKTVASCDEARVLWMDTCFEQAKRLRAAGLHEYADALYPLTMQVDPVP